MTRVLYPAAILGALATIAAVLSGTGTAQSVPGDVSHLKYGKDVPGFNQSVTTLNHLRYSQGDSGSLSGETALKLGDQVCALSSAGKTARDIRQMYRDKHAMSPDYALEFTNAAYNHLCHLVPR